MGLRDGVTLKQGSGFTLSLSKDEKQKEARMAGEHEEHTHEHSFIQVFEGETISVFEQVPHRAITLQLHDRGLALDLTYEGALALGEALAAVVEHVRAASGRG